jgi:hypothetical protein
MLAFSHIHLSDTGTIKWIHKEGLYAFHKGGQDNEKATYAAYDVASGVLTGRLRQQACG